MGKLTIRIYTLNKIKRNEKKGEERNSGAVKLIVGE